MSIKAVIVCVAKLESDYIEEWVKYSFSLGFHHIYLYDNEDKPIYKKLLQSYLDKMTIIHYPGNNYKEAVQYMILSDFAQKYMFTNNNTHVAHIDIDEFIVLKKHKNISEFINEYIVDDCGGIAIPWRHFGSSGHTSKNNLPITQRFTMCEKIDKMYSRPTGGVFKTLFDVNNIEEFCLKEATHKCGYNHMPVLKENKFIKTTTGEIIEPFGVSQQFRPNYTPRKFFGKEPSGNCKVKNINFDVIQLNHYKCKTLEEYRYIKTRGNACRMNRPVGTADFNQFNINDEEDLTAKLFYQNLTLKE